MFFGRRRSAVQSILIVEDEPLVAFDTEHFLALSGYRIQATVEGYADFSSQIAQAAPDLVIADIRLAGEGTGIDVARLAHQHGVAVLFVTGHCPVDARDLAIGCLAKPYAQRDLLQSIRAADAILRGEAPGRLPLGLTLFATLPGNGA